jgi:thiol-disulfide isomerase/thioredoxin
MSKVKSTLKKLTTKDNVTIILGVSAFVLVVVYYYLYVRNSREAFSSENVGPTEAKDGELVLLMIHAPWCGHCKTLMPTWDDAHSKYDGTKVNGKVVRISKYNGDEDAKGLAKKLGVKGFPTIKCMKSDGSVDEYEGDRSMSGIMNYIKSATM